MYDSDAPERAPSEYAEVEAEPDAGSTARVRVAGRLVRPRPFGLLEAGSPGRWRRVDDGLDRLCAEQRRARGLGEVAEPETVEGVPDHDVGV